MVMLAIIYRMIDGFWYLRDHLPFIYEHHLF